MPRRLTSAERAAQETRVVQLRRARQPWSAIGEALGVTGPRAYQIYQRALASNPVSAIQVDEHRIEETELIDLAVRNLMIIATGANTGAQVKVQAWSTIRAWAERKAKLLGLDAPQRTEVVTMDALDAEIARLEAELAGGSESREAPADP